MLCNSLCLLVCPQAWCLGPSCQEITKNWNSGKWETDLTRRCAWLRRVDWCAWFLEISSLHLSNLTCEILQCSFLVLWISAVFRSSVKLGFDFPGDLPTQKFWSQAESMRSRRAQLSMQSDLQKSNFLWNPNFLSERERGIFHLVKVVLFRLALIPCKDYLC